VAEFVYDRDDLTVVVLRLPRHLWDAWEYRHGHYGKAIHALRESVMETMAHRMLVKGNWSDLPDPFYRSHQGDSAK